MARLGLRSAIIPPHVRIARMQLSTVRPIRAGMRSATPRNGARGIYPALCNLTHENQIFILVI